jgi:hypothetical protein
MNEEQPHNLKDKLLRDIHAGTLSMRPRVYFVLLTLGTMLASLVIITATVLIVNFILFGIRIGSHDALLGFGPQGIGFFLWIFPWHMLVLDVVFIGLLIWLLRQFRIGYAIPVLYLVIGLVLASTALGFVIDRGTFVNDRLHEGRLRLPPPLGALYGEFGKQKPRGSGICRCTIESIQGNTITLIDTRDATTTLTVALPERSLYVSTSSLKVGDVVYVAGVEKDGLIQAFGLRKVDAEKHYPFIKPGGF